MSTKSEALATDVVALLRARNPLLWIVTREEQRVEKFLFEAAASAKYLARFWDVAAGVTGLDGKPDKTFPDTDGDSGGADAALRLVSERTGERGVLIMRNLNPWILPPIGLITQRRLCNLARELPSKPRESAQSVIIISPSSEVPAELANHATVLEWSLPDREEIGALFDATVQSLSEDMQTEAASSREAAVDAAVGLSGEEAQATFARSLVQLRRIDPAVVASEKKRVIRGSGLEWIDTLADGMKAVGGLDVWKGWASSRASAYSPEAREYGLPSPKGALLVGVPGCGKTLSAKALAGEWGVPLIKLDLGALKGKYVGQSEANIRQAFSTIEAIGRCVVIADEVEKSLAGASGEAGDGGVAADALGALLSWMQDRQGDAFVIATANDIDKLPPELLRKGRFDEVWWVGLPNRDERGGVIAAAMRSHGRDSANILTDGGKAGREALLDATEKFSGAEIAALVPDAMFAAFAENGREITVDDLLIAAKAVKPQGSSRKRPDYAREATSPVATASTGGARALDLSD